MAVQRASLQACALRIARLSPLGVPFTNPPDVVLTEGMVSLEVAVDVTKGDRFTISSSCGVPCISYRGKDRIDGMDLSLQICGPDPWITWMLAGGTILGDIADPDGWAAPSHSQVGTDGVSLEVWTRRIINGATDLDFPYFRWVFPRTFWTVGDRALVNGILDVTFDGYGRENPNFGTGPGEDISYAEAGRHYIHFRDAAIPSEPVTEGVAAAFIPLSSSAVGAP